MATKRKRAVLKDGTSGSDLRKWCLFCYKPCDSYNFGATKAADCTEDDTGSDEDERFRLNLLLLQRCLIGNDLMGSKSGLELLRLSACQDCALLLKQFCECYHQLKCLEMRLDWRLRMMLGIMSSAEKVRSRVKEFENDLNPLLADSQKTELLKEFSNFRRKLIGKGREKLQRSFPRVWLKRCQVPGNSADDAVTSPEAKRSKIRIKNEEIVVPQDNLAKLEQCQSQPQLPFTSSGYKMEPESELSQVNSVDIKYEVINIHGDFNGPNENGVQHSDSGSSSDGESASPFEESQALNGLEFGLEGKAVTSEVTTETTSLVNPIDVKLETEELCPREKSRYSLRTRMVNPGGIDSDSGTTQTTSIIFPNTGRGGQRNLRRHDIKRSPLIGEERLKGDLCDAKFAGISEYKTHRRRHHKYALKQDQKPALRFRHTRKIVKTARELKRWKPYASLLTSLLGEKGKLLSLRQLAMNALLKQQYRCEVSKCPLRRHSFFNKVDYHNHSKLHGSFQCAFCKVTRSYAPDLTSHELENHSNANGIKKEEISENEDVSKPTKNLTVCSRCNFKSHMRQVRLHHLKSHLKLKTPFTSCPVCNVAIRGESKIAFLRHFQMHHDLVGVIDMESIPKCDQDPNCRAYFRTEEGLRRHKRYKHGFKQGRSATESIMCYLCGAKCRGLRLYGLHRMKMHQDVVKFNVPCNVDGCEEAFESEMEMRRHIMRLHKRMTKCPTCQKMVFNVNLKKHAESHQSPIEVKRVVEMSKLADHFGVKPIECVERTCSQCSKRFFSEGDMETHLKLHGEFKCTFCDVVLTYAPDLLNHELSHTVTVNDNRVGSKSKSQLHHCPRCAVVRKDINDMLDHFMEFHLSLKMDRHTCTICAKVFDAGKENKKRFRYFFNHYKISHNLNKLKHTGQVHKCDESNCSVYFVTKKQIQFHKNNHKFEGTYQVCFLDDGVKMYQCQKCGRRYRTEWKARDHQWTSHGNFAQQQKLKLRCTLETCHHYFTTKEELDTHLKKAVAMKCGKCEKVFHGAKGLLVHQRFHINQDTGKDKSRWKCKVCGKNNKCRKSMELHMKSHEGPDSWEYMCSLCPKKCLTEQKLQEHMRVHSQVKPFICEICGVKYAHRHNLRIHVNSKHGDVTRMEPLRKRPKNNPSKGNGTQTSSSSSSKAPPTKKSKSTRITKQRN